MDKLNHYTTREEIQQMRMDLQKELNVNPKGISKRKKRSSNMIFIGIIILFAVLFVKIQLDKRAGEIPDILGYQIFQVETGSMMPTFPIGSLIVNKIPTSEQEITVSDIITYEQDGQIITHRVVEILEDENGVFYYKTKGDNSDNSMDPWDVYYDQIISVNQFKLPF